MNDAPNSIQEKSAQQIADEKRAALELAFGKENVFDTNELREKFEVHSFCAPFVTVTRKKDNKKGSLEFLHYPRFYFNFILGD
jgi:hypothetical protein